MKYPLDVHKRASQAGQLNSEDKAKFIVMMTIIVFVVSLIGVITIFRKFLGLGIGWAVLVQLVLFLLIGSFIFRHFIFKEDERKREFQGYESDSFARIYNMRKDAVEETEVLDKKINVFEYSNGSAMFCICLKYGSNDNRKSQNTLEMFTEIFRVLSRNGLEYRTTTMPEDFENSVEYEALIADVEDIEYRELSEAMLNIVNTLMEESNKRSNVDITYIMVRTRSNYQRYELEDVISRILTILRGNVSCIRSIDFLDKFHLYEFFKTFYGIEAIDLSMVKALNITEGIDEEFKSIVKLYQLRSVSGKTLTDKKIIDSVLETEVRELNFND